MDIGWDPVTATSWLRPTECEDDPVDQWDIPAVGDPGFTPTGSFQALFEDAEADIRGFLWRAASKHTAGQDLAGGGD
eukprot:1952686-Pyramimonas_sp.AAC.1